ncbi:MAG: manganese efflux pump MntP family protein [Proteobacteria bacterium]|nr:manganese efflux pump MntP family protein [Pseudomonadota bacterium]
MKTPELIGIAVALAMDAFAVALASGVSLGRVDARQTFRLAWHFGLFQALMPILGWLGGTTIRTHIEAYDHWLAFALLAFVGGRMLLGAFEGEDVRGRSTDPTRGVTMVMLSVATSIDALAVGLSMALLGLSIWVPALIIGLVAAGFTAGGLHLGRAVGAGRRLSTWAESVGGLLLLGIGLNILREHGVFSAWF